MDWGKWHGHAPTPGSTILATRISSSLVDMASMSAAFEGATRDDRLASSREDGEKARYNVTCLLPPALVGVRPGIPDRVLDVDLDAELALVLELLP